jgi:hypothetical protein
MREHGLTQAARVATLCLALSACASAPLTQSYGLNEGWSQSRGPAPYEAELTRVCGCQDFEGQFVRCVVIVALAAGGKSGQRLETWELQDKEWYWVFRSPHDPQGRCPG